MPDPLLDIRDLTLRRSGRCLLEGITLAIAPAEIHALVGGNGCGKTSLAKAVMGCEGYRPNSGEIRFDGRRVDNLPLHERAEAVVYGTTEGNAAGARGHMDCTEIVQDHAVGESVPQVRVGHPEAKVTHEAAIGTVDQTQLETLMAHGLSPDQAVELVISGLLRPERAAGGI
ncbi:MAG: ATP-binding cassette domain-containing protein [Gammaproteobacteria bacterium]|nr:ATP-binding cassette domain-containing protein [Gammaproteobacteria bacterium]NIR98011.1 ATP-binding cassette domain-containing protein [Gammaproteobacteria bacterium]NIT63710.1 ATP-binding cassette domain-containing protein [Gammaproteobacteria bacterium]NIV20674.1 ATP-binding cassette domain-containing protein [Gammaproteobacteria bacterium]NIX11382.1 ATP-binding cassette domain-containing protein [Gammaproteobacteria bacterium]